MENHVRERMIELLKGHPEGLTIQEIASALNVNRITASKYVYGLVSEDIVSQKKVGPAKLCFMVNRND
jgi:DNA-binding IclR family transcriptional regulator